MRFFLSYHYTMEWFWIILGILLCVGGILGSLLPLIPGPPIAYLGLLVQQFREPDPYSGQFLLIWAVLVILTLVLDYFIPVWGTKKFGGTKYGVWGCTLGFLVAFWLGPWGIILGPFAGAFIGEYLANRHARNAWKAAWGSFVGFLLGSFLKLVACFFMLYAIFQSV